MTIPDHKEDRSRGTKTLHPYSTYDRNKGPPAAAEGMHPNRTSCDTTLLNLINTWSTHSASTRDASTFFFYFWMPFGGPPLAIPLPWQSPFRFYSKTVQTTGNTRQSAQLARMRGSDIISTRFLPIPRDFQTHHKKTVFDALRRPASCKPPVLGRLLDATRDPADLFRLHSGPLQTNRKHAQNARMRRSYIIAIPILHHFDYFYIFSMPFLRQPASGTPWS